MTEPLLLTPKDVARRLGIGINATNNLISSGQIQSIPRPGSTGATPRRMVRPVDLDAYIAGLGTGAADGGRG